MRTAVVDVGGGLRGVWGMLIGVPLTTVLYQLLRQSVLRQEEIKKAQAKEGQSL